MLASNSQLRMKLDQGSLTKSGSPWSRFCRPIENSGLDFVSLDTSTGALLAQKMAPNSQPTAGTCLTLAFPNNER